MHVFPAEIPSPEAPRSDVVEIRVARKVAPLFGVPVDGNPFDRTWICDFTALSLAELGRGAPSPDRSEQSRLDLTDSATAWDWAGRAVWTPRRVPTPGALTNTTLNRFGPNTKAAAVLTGVNRLLRGPSGAVAAACRQLTATGCDPEVRLAVWAGLILEVYRAQPALVVAAIQARLVQRSLSARWGAQVDPTGATAPGAPSEIHPEGLSSNGTPPDDPCQPSNFALVDATLPLLGLAEDSPAGPGLLTPEVLDDLASAWCHRLLAVGRPGRGVVWLAEDEAGSRRAHAMLRVGAAVAPFVASALGGVVSPDSDQPRYPVLPVLPQIEDLAGLPVSHRRAHLLVAHVAASYLRYRDELLLAWPQLREATRTLVDQAIDRCAGTLAAQDPVATQLAGYAAYLKVWDCLQTRCQARDEHLDRLRDSEQAVISAWRAGRLDPGAASYLLEIGAVAMAEAERQTTDIAGPATDRAAPDRAAAGRAAAGRAVHGGRPTAAARARWSAILGSRGFANPEDPLSVIESATDAQIFHLQHYTGWLASTGRRTDLRNALALQQRVAAVRARVVRSEPARFAAKSAAARGGYERAADIATRLLAATPVREQTARTEAARIAAEHATAVLADPSFSGLLRTGPSAEARRTARVVANALLAGAEHGVTIGAAEAASAVALLDAAFPAATFPDATFPDEAYPDATYPPAAEQSPAVSESSAEPWLATSRTTLARLAEAT